MSGDLIIEIKLSGATKAPCGCKRTTLIMEATSPNKPGEPLLNGYFPVHCRTCGAGWLQEMPIKREWLEKRGLSALAGED